MNSMSVILGWHDIACLSYATSNNDWLTEWLAVDILWMEIAEVYHWKSAPGTNMNAIHPLLLSNATLI